MTTAQKLAIGLGVIGGVLVLALTKKAPEACTPGQTKCAGFDLYECSAKRQWILKEANSPTCGWLPGLGPEPQPQPWDANSRLCPYCGLVFASFAILLDHIHIVHPGLPDPVEVPIFQ